MDQNRPIKQNTFVLVAVVLFNLLWLTLLFLSCQADNKPSPTSTPEARMGDPLTCIMAGDSLLDAPTEKENQSWWGGVHMNKDQQPQFWVMIDLSSYNEPLYDPPSTGSITPVI